MVQFSTRMDLLKGSEIRELLKLTAQPDIISFAGGMPAPELFPVEQMMEASRAVLEENGRAALQYSSTEGHPRLRQQIAERMLAKNNIHTDADHILVTSGSQQGLDFSARVFLNPGDVVLLESPSYLGAVNAFKACEPRFIEVPTDNGGMIMEELEKILATTERVKMIYVIPDFQNPTGRTWDLERRHQFMEIVNRYEIPVIEDNPYGELRFEGADLPGYQGPGDLSGHLLQDPGPRLPHRLGLRRGAHSGQVQLHGAGCLPAGLHHRPDGNLQVDRHVRPGRPCGHHPGLL